MTRLAITFLLGAFICLPNDAVAAGASQAIPTEFRVRPIGHVKTSGDRTLIVLHKEFQTGLLGLEGFSHILLFWWFDKNDTPEGRSVLRVHPRANLQNPLTGVFATRSPRRPNLIALMLCKVVAVNDNVVEIEGTDAFDGTPVLDIKPFLPGYDTAEDVKVPGWVKVRWPVTYRRARLPLRVSSPEIPARPVFLLRILQGRATDLLTGLEQPAAVHCTGTRAARNMLPVRILHQSRHHNFHCAAVEKSL